MELDEFKTIIRQKPVNIWIKNVLTETEINVGKESRSVMGKIKKSLLLEMSLSVLFVFLISFIIYRLHNFYVELFACLMTAFCLCFTFYIVRLYRKILYHQSAMRSVKKNLEQAISIMEQFTRLYFILTLVMVPVILLAAILSGYASILTTVKTPINPYSAQQLVALIILSIAWYVTMYFFTKWYIRKLYGDHLGNLKAQLKELEDV